MSKVIFYGVRGSLPVCEKEFSLFGGNTSCIAIIGDNDRIGILDAGTGIRKLGKDILKNFNRQKDIYLLLSHFHWDHIQGFPFFAPAYDPSFDFTITAIGKDNFVDKLEKIFEFQQQPEYFPIALNKMGAKFNFLQTHSDTFVTKYGIKVTANKHTHPGGAYGYRIEEGEKVIVYCTDIEHGNGLDSKVIEFARNADLLIHDAQYTPEELVTRKGWGHSSWEQAIQVAKSANVKKLALFHHDPEHDDEFLLKTEKKCQEMFPECFFAREGLEINL